MDKVMWWGRPTEGVGEKPNTPKPIPIIKSNQGLQPETPKPNAREIHSNGGKRPTSEKP
jgi:hypothetical protein